MKTELSKLLAEKDSEVHTMTPDARVVDAVHAMNHHNIGALLVVEGGTIVGIFTERDVLVRVVAPKICRLLDAPTNSTRLKFTSSSSFNC